MTQEARNCILVKMFQQFVKELLYANKFNDINFYTRPVYIQTTTSVQNRSTDDIKPT